MQPFYITTPIYYVNDKPHLGHAYTTILADIFHRTYQLIGRESFLLTGTDEHGQKVFQAAKKTGQSPQEHVEKFHQRFRQTWQRLNIDYDHFVRTTDPSHVTYVQQYLQKLYDQNDIYKKEYSGWYSVGEERFFTDDELVDGLDPISGRPVEWENEVNYFFRMSRYQAPLLSYLEKHSDFVLPESRMNEVRSFLKEPLNDLCISRPRKRLPWGILLPFDNDFVTYVWFDALLNYLSAVEDKSWKNATPKKLWPAHAHIIGKDIVITHGVYFPTMLLALNLPLPNHLVSHGWWLQKGKKLSKSSGNVIDPIDLLEKLEPDICRYFLCREMTLGNDVTYDQDLLTRCINRDLANNLGNTLSRVKKILISFLVEGTWQLNAAQKALLLPEKKIDWSLYQEYCSLWIDQSSSLNPASKQKKIKKIFDQVFAKGSQTNLTADQLQMIAQDHPRPQEFVNEIQEIIDFTNKHLIWHSLPKNLANFDLSFFLQDIQKLISKINIFFEKNTPWKLDKKKQYDRLSSLVYPSLEALRICLVLLSPVMPEKSKEGLAMLGYTLADSNKMAENSIIPPFAWGQLPEKINREAGSPLFPRWQDFAQPKQNASKMKRILPTPTDKK